MSIIIPKRTGEVNPKTPPYAPPRLLAAYHNKSGHKRCGGFWQRAKQHAGRLAEEVLPPRHSSAGGICPFSPKPKRRRGRAAAVVPYAASCPFDRTLGFPSPRRRTATSGAETARSVIHSRLSASAAAVRRRRQRRFCRFSLTEKIFSFFSRTIDFCAAQGFILFSAEKSGASPNGACASAASYAGCKYKAFGKPFCGARKGRKHKKSHLSLGVLPLAERTNAGNSRSE